MTAILGISAFYHDSAAALVVDGAIAAAAQEERFTRVKHDSVFPTRAIEFCLRHAGVRAEDLDLVAFYDKPLLKFERLLDTYQAFAPRGFASFCAAMPVWLKQKMRLGRAIRRGLGGRYPRRVVFAEHHESHAASAFFPSPFEEAAIVTLDGVGEWATGTIGVGRGSRVELLQQMRFPHSLGLLYSAFTYFCGFRVNSGEYKLMGLAPFGEPRFEETIRKELIDLKEDGSFRLNLRYFTFPAGLRMTGGEFARLFGGPARDPETPITQREMDLAASIQRVTEDVVLRTARHAHRLSGSKNVCLAGGVALNCVANGRVLREGAFENVWVQPAAGDAGGALGCALLAWHQLMGRERRVQSPDAQRASWLGPKVDEAAARAMLDARGAKYRVLGDDAALCDAVAGHLAEGKVVGWVQGRMEFGPRALGARSILGDPRRTDMQTVMNVKIKFRESFRPFAPAVLRERAHEFFEVRAGEDSAYMLLVAPVREQVRVKDGDSDGASAARGLDRVKSVRSTLPAVTHVDYSARVQTIDGARHGRFCELLRAFERRTGCPVLINTSFNVRGEPIVCSGEDAYRCFMATNMDVLVIERLVLLKEEQPVTDAAGSAAYVAQFKLD